MEGQRIGGRDRLRRAARAVLVGLAAEAALGCSSDPVELPARDQVEIFSWWISPGEVEALDELLQVHARHYPRVRVVNSVAEDRDHARATLQSRMEEGAPPDTFQANIGADLFRWLSPFGGDAGSRLESLDELAAKEAWHDVFPTEVLAALSDPRSGQLYGVPTNIHRLNTLFYDRRYFERHALRVPRDPGELLELCEQIGRLAEPRDCLAVGNKNHWPMALFAFGAMFPALAGAATYNAYWAGELPYDAAPMLEALEWVLRLWPHFNEDASLIDWDEGVEKLVSGQSAMVVMGDWAKGYLQTRGLTPEVDFMSVPFPGSESAFVFTADCFPLPNGARRRGLARDLLRTFGSVEGQLAFNLRKGSIPARVDYDPAAFDPLARRTIQDFRAPAVTLVKALSGLLPSHYPGGLNASIEDMLENEDPAYVVNQLRIGHALLRR